LPPEPGGGGEKMILVSFDGGSSDRGATEILDALRGRAIRTTIFLTGQFIRRYPELTRRIAEDGHEVGNHTFDHPHLTTWAENGRQETRSGVTEEMLDGELERTAALYRATTGRDMAPLWRAPFGEENPEILAWARRAGWAHVSWTHGHGTNLDALDWVSDPDSPRYRPSERVISRLLASARPGDIILMHLGSDRDDPVAGHLPRLLDTLASEGYRFSTASELIASGDAVR
jgi:peptidoglycan/xylan/chitin deacetylase (PgdA/CDA1 family)